MQADSSRYRRSKTEPRAEVKGFHRAENKKAAEHFRGFVK
jgi:hypothetical protein